MKKIVILVLVVFLLISILIGCSNVFVPDNRKDTVTIIDATGAVVEVPYPVERIVSMNSGLSTLIAAFGEGDKIVGRDTFSTFPSSLISVYAVGKNSAHPNIELIFDQKPDIVVADNTLILALNVDPELSLMVNVLILSYVIFPLIYTKFVF